MMRIIEMIILIMFQERIEKILKAGANVVLTTGGIDDLCLKYFVEAGAMAIRRCKKIDLKVRYPLYNRNASVVIILPQV